MAILLKMLGLTSKAYCVPRGPVKSLLLFLFHLAWKSRIRLPVLIAVGFMVLDLRMQLEINIDLGMGGNQGIPIVGEEDDQNDEMLIDGSDSEDDSDSISTDPCSYHSSSNSENSDDDENLTLDCSDIALCEDDTRLRPIELYCADDSTRIENLED